MTFSSMKIRVLIVCFTLLNSCKPRKSSSLETANSNETALFSKDDLAAEVDFYADLMTDRAGGTAINQKNVTHARELALAGNYEEAANEVVKIKVGIILSQFDAVESGYRGVLDQLKEQGFYSGDEYQKLRMILRHIRDGLQMAKSGSMAPDVGLTGYVLFDNLIQLLYIQIDSEFYPFFKDVQPLVKKSMSALLQWDEKQEALQRSKEELDTQQLLTQSKAVNDAFLKVRSEYVANKQRELTTSRILELKSAQLVGAKPDDVIVLDSKKINQAITKLDLAGAEFMNKNDAHADQLIQDVIQLLFSSEMRGRLDQAQLYTVLSFQTVGNYLISRCSECLPSDVQQLKTLTQNMAQAAGSENFNLTFIAAKNILDAIGKQMKDETRTAFYNEAMTEAAVARFTRQLSAYKSLVRETRRRYTTAVEDSSAEKTASMAALDSIDHSLNRLAIRARTAQTSAYIAGVSTQQSKIQLVLYGALEAVLNHSSTPGRYADIFTAAVNGYNPTSSSQRLLSDTAYKELSSVLNERYSEEWWAAWLNKNNAMTVAFSALLAGEAISIIYTGGSSSLAIPATLTAMRGLAIAGQVVLGVAKVVIAAGSVLNIANRAKSGGVYGLLSPDTAFDALALLTVLPRIPIPGAAQAGAATSRYRDLQMSLATLQYSTIGTLSTGAFIYSGYQAVFAESIATEMAKQGYETTTWDIRRRAGLNLAMGALAWMNNAKFVQKETATNSKGMADLKQSTSLRESFLIKRLKGALNPPRAARNYFQENPTLLRGIMGAGIGIGYGMLDYLLISEAVLLSYTNLDINYLNKIEQKHPFPSLKAGESALGLVGFNPKDSFLYMGAHGRSSNKRENDLYQGKYDIDDFASPDDLIAKISEHAKKNGKIKYLKIMTHGLPGKLYTREVELVSPVTQANTPVPPRWVDAKWFSENMSKLQSIARDSFADDARIVIFACLVGSNLDFESKSTDKIDAGDNFMKLLGESFLVNGGSIDASKRILTGLDVAYGDQIRGIANKGIKDDARRVMVPVFDLSEDSVTASTVLTRKPKDLSGLMVYREANAKSIYKVKKGSVDPDKIFELAVGLGQQAGHTIYTMPESILSYGIQLEGPWWENRYSFLEVAKH